MRNFRVEYGTGDIVKANVKVTGAARLYRAASSDRRERGRPPCYATRLLNLKSIPTGERFTLVVSAANSRIDCGISRSLGARRS